uniref:Uncharacterized protein n=1 Tax=Oryza nivara TaxID=4536 RepID=A0A0E0FIU2_ORYNI
MAAAMALWRATSLLGVRRLSRDYIEAYPVRRGEFRRRCSAPAAYGVSGGASPTMEPVKR